MSTLFIIISMTLAVSAMCSLFEATLYSTRMAALESARSGGPLRRQAERFIEMKQRIAVPTAAILILNTVANTAGATLAGVYAARELGTGYVPLLSVLLTLAILFLSEIMPKTYGATHWKRLWPRIVTPLSALAWILSPLIRLTEGFSALFTGSTGPTPVTQDEIVSMIKLGGRAGELNRHELELLHSVFQLDDLVCRQIMVPRGQVDYLDASMTVEAALQGAAGSQHTRYPLCNGGLDDIVGLVHVKDLAHQLAQGQTDLRALARPLARVPETKKVSRFLREMQRGRRHMAAVIDEHGTFAGLVTLENAIEQIVGPVQDEFDEEPVELVREDTTTVVVLGRVLVERLNSELDLDLYAAGVDTLSGLLVSRAGRLLAVGDEIELDGAIAEVLQVRADRAERVRLRLTASLDDTSDEAPAAAESASGVPPAGADAAPADAAKVT